MCIVLITSKSDMSDRYFIECQTIEEAKLKAEPYRVDSRVRIYRLGELVSF